MTMSITKKQNTCILSLINFLLDRRAAEARNCYFVQTQKSNTNIGKILII